jgi:3alpha(or 20beta)-hydroxysteroid dehydrogenase
MSRRLEGKTIIVTGGTRGMGEAIVRGVVAHGGNAVFGGRDSDAGQAIERELGASARFFRLDVRSEADWRAIVAGALEIFGSVDGLVNNAGAMGKNPLAETSLDMATDIVMTNQIAVLLAIKHVVGPMRRAGKGSIVNIGSIAAHRAFSGLSAYSGTKAAVAGITRAAAMELAAEQIRVNTIHPGTFDTQMLTDNMGAEGAAYGAEVTPLKRVGQPSEMVGPVVFLLSDDASFVTGAELAVDGGLAL